LNFKTTLDPEEWMISLYDVKRLYMSMWKRLLRWSVIGSAVAFAYFASNDPKYEAEASFREGVERSSAEGVLELLGGIASQNQPQASAFMKSYQVLRPLVEKMGLQIAVPDKRWKISKFIQHFRENLKAEKGLPLSDVDPFVFRDVSYDREEGFDFYVSFTDRDHYRLFSSDKKNELCKGTLGTPLDVPDSFVHFTLVKTPHKLKMGAFYPFFAVHWSSAAGALQSGIKIKSDKDNKSILNVSFSHRDRHLAAQIVNELMSQYQLYLKREHDFTAKEQLHYLENKQEQIFDKMDHLFDQHTAYLSKNLEENGFIGIDQESQSLLVPHQQMQNKVLSIDVELARLSEIEQEGNVIAIAADSSFSQGINLIGQKIQDLKQQRDLLELSLCQVSEHALESRRDELKDIRNQRCAVEALMQEVDLGQEISYFDLNEGLCDWARTIHDPEEREDFAEYLENYARILSMREKMLHERFFYGNNAPSELEGIDAISAKNLFLDYNSKLDTAEALMRHYEQFKKEIPHPDFDISSLSSVLKDPLCQKIIGEASELGLQLKDEKHHSSKEGARWEEEIALHRKILTNHLDQLYKVEELNSNLIREKMVGLQKVSLDGINRQISVLHEQVNDAIKQHRQALLSEKDLLEKRMEIIRSSLAKILPEKWRFEKWLGIKTELVSKVMETVTGVVESKTISAHLHHVESKPLDCALVPRAPVSQRLRKMSLVGAFAFPFCLFSFAFIRRLLKGFPLSLEKLKALRLPVLGQISSFCDGPSVETPTGPDLDLLRQLALFAEGGKVISLIGGLGPDYSYALGENLARMSAKSIILRCDFNAKFRKEDAPGLLQVWKGEMGELPIRKGKGFDFITSGGYSPFGTEIIQSHNFTQFVDLLKDKYDWVFLLFRAPLDSAESLAALRLCEKAVVTVSGEKTEELTPFVNWAYHGNDCRLTFIARS